MAANKQVFLLIIPTCPKFNQKLFLIFNTKKLKIKLGRNHFELKFILTYNTFTT